MEERTSYSSYQQSDRDAHTPDGEFGVAELWRALDVIHKEMNAHTRRNPSDHLSAPQIEAINGTLMCARGLLDRHGQLDGLDLLPKACPVSCGDALILVGAYRAALRSFRVNVLGESSYAF